MNLAFCFLTECYSNEPLAEIRILRPTYLHVVIESLEAQIYGAAVWEKLFLQTPLMYYYLSHGPPTGRFIPTSARIT